MTRWLPFRVLTTLLILLLGAGMPLALAAEDAGSPTPDLLATPVPTSGDFAGLVDIGGGRTMFLECRGEGGPTVILVSGYRNDADIWDSIAIDPATGQTAVLPGVAGFTRVCAYDRPGTVLDGEHLSRSDPVPMPRTALDVVSDLHTLLHTAGVPGPYVLAGHSFGGLFSRLYASIYPEDVAGLVMVDALPETIPNHLAPDEWQHYRNAIQLVPKVLEQYPALETLDVDASFAQMRHAAARTPYLNKPLVVITRTEPFGIPESSLGFSPVKLEKAWLSAQRDLVALTPDAQHLVADQSAHYIQITQPDVVITAIRHVVEAVRDPEMWATPQA
ncbi:MAG: alpha/beta hydrolase [Chloroflexota bacterium]|nr:alpha/beta hydrolase [Chloroflexota bacterium]